MTEKLLSIEGVKAKTGFGTTKIYAMIGAGEFPKPAKIGAASRWRESAVDQWIAAQFADS